MKKHIYADNAASTKLSKAALDAMLPLLENCYANPSQPYFMSAEAKSSLNDSREKIASLINCFPDEIIFTSGGTEGNNTAIKGTVTSRKEIITGSTEHKSVLLSAAAMTRYGFMQNTVNCDGNGIITPDALADVISQNTALVSVMTVNNETGAIQPVKELAQTAHGSGALFHTDAVQAMGHIPIDVKDTGVDLLSASAHKFNGPRGTGFLYIRRGTPLHSLLDGGAQEYGLRAGTENVASIAGMAAALEENYSILELNRRKILEAENALISALNSTGIDYIRNSGGHSVNGIISLSFRNADGEMLLHRLDLTGISVSTGSACDSVNTQVSHVLSAMKVPPEYAKGTIRISLCAENTPEESVYIADSIKSILDDC